MITGIPRTSSLPYLMLVLLLVAFVFVVANVPASTSDEELEALPEAIGRFICAWCLKDLGPAGTVEDSHGICSECAKTYLGQ